MSTVSSLIFIRKEKTMVNKCTFRRLLKTGSLIALAWVSMTGSSLYAQQLDQIGKKGGIKVNGSLGANSSLYWSDGINNRMSPYTYTLNGAMNISLYGWNIPLYCAYSNQSWAYTKQPFNIISLTPTYKKLKLYLGFTSMSFSSYTLSGHQFLGGGFEWGIKSFTIAAMGGRLIKAVQYDSTNTTLVPTFDRYGAGLKLQYAANGTEVQVISFYAKDDARSLTQLPPKSAPTPQENAVYSFGIKRPVNKLLSVRAEVATSAWTSDINSAVNKDDNALTHKALFIPTRFSTVYYNAYKTGIDMNFNIFQLGVGYERVEPGYKTLGAYYMVNDFENVTLNAATTLLNKKMSLSGNIGLQHDDLNNTKASNMNRLVGSLSLNYAITKRLNVNAAFSGFNSYTKIKPIEQEYIRVNTLSQVDTMNVVQVTNTFNGGISYKLLENDDVTHTISGNGNYALASSKQGSNRFGNSMLNGSTRYGIAYKKSGLMIDFSINSSVNKYQAGNALFVGLGSNVSLPVWKKKLRISLASNASENYEKSDLKAVLYSVTNSYALKVAKHHSFQASVRYSGRARLKDATLSSYNTSFNEIMAMLGYSFSF